MNIVAADMRNGTLGDIAHTMQAAGIGSERGGNPNAIPHVLAYGGNNGAGPVPVSTALTAHPGGRYDYDSETFVAHTLRGEGFDASEDGTGRGTPLVPVPFDTTQITSASNYSNPKAGDPCHPLAAGAHAPAVAFDFLGTPASEVAREADVHTPLRARKPGQFENSTVTTVVQHAAVRRLMPTECEALQGFPRNYTAIPWRGKPASECPDGPRYKALGNSWAVNCARWIGWRINLVEQIHAQRRNAA